jgi:hypothetical protein
MINKYQKKCKNSNVKMLLYLPVITKKVQFRIIND